VYLIDKNRKSVQLTLDFSNPSSFDITLHVKIVDVDATGIAEISIYIFVTILFSLEGTDYICTPSCNVTFKAGTITKVFNFTLQNNSMFEGLEHFKVGMESPDYISQSNPSEVLLLVVDIDG